MNSSFAKMRVTLLYLSLLLTSCASIVTGQNQAVSVDTSPVKDAVCTLSNDKGTWFVNSPGSTTILRSYSDLHVSCEKKGFGKGITTVKSSTKGMAFGNILVGGLIGTAVDCGTGAAYDYPSLINVPINTELALEK